jgi:peptide/nickel transport system ATP-binding protein
MSHILDIRDLSVAITVAAGSIPVLRNVDFQIGPGEIVGIVGESGAGKSTVGAAVNGLLMNPMRITGGEIRLEGTRIDQYDEAAWQKIRGRKIGSVFQDPLTSLDPLFTIGDQIVETMRIHMSYSRKAARGRAADLLNELGILNAVQVLDYYPHQLSGGMRQRVVIALALCGEPSLIIADEPTSALDVSVQMQIVRLLRRVCEERGTAIILISHDFGVISEAADRVVVMYCGRVVEQGRTGSVTAEPMHPYTTGLINCIPDTQTRHARLSDIGGELPRLGTNSAGCSFYPRCSERLAGCASNPPEITVVNGREVACWLYNRSALAERRKSS